MYLIQSLAMLLQFTYYSMCLMLFHTLLKNLFSLLGLYSTYNDTLHTERGLLT
jgi:hypothetical protein